MFSKLLSQKGSSSARAIAASSAPTGPNLLPKLAKSIYSGNGSDAASLQTSYIIEEGPLHSNINDNCSNHNRCNPNISNFSDGDGAIGLQLTNEMSTKVLEDSWVDDQYNNVLNSIHDTQSRLLSHSMYSELRDIKSLQMLMSSHVFQVWDFMFLVKKMQYLLQRDNMLPWLPPVNNQITRFIQEIVLCEETDSFDELFEITGKESMSHFEIYLLAMKQIGMNTDFINNIIGEFEKMQQIGGNVNINSNENENSQIRNILQSGIKNNFYVAQASLDMFEWNLNLTQCNDFNNLHLICAAFIFGRENIIPPMFEKVIKFIPQSDETRLFWLYLERHIEVDGHGGDNGTDSHQILGEKLIKLVCNYDEMKWKQCLDIAMKSLQMRCKVWDQVEMKIKH